MIMARNGPFTRRGQAKLFPLILAGVLICLGLMPMTESLANPNAPEPLTREAFTASWSQALREGRPEEAKAVASRHRHFLRPLFDSRLTQYSEAVGRGDSQQSQELLAQLATLAGLCRELALDQAPLRQLQLYQSWSPVQHRLRHQAAARVNEARAAFREGRYGAVREPGEAAAAIFVELGDEQSEAALLHVLGQAARRLADYPEAGRRHDRALLLARQSQDRLGQGRALIDLGDVHERQKDFSRATQLYQEALATLKLPADLQETNRALRQLGDVYVALGDFENAYRQYSQALLNAQDLKDILATAECHVYLGFFYRRLGDYDQALKHHRLALEAAGQVADPVSRAKALAMAFNHIGLCQEEKAKLAAAEQNTAEAINLYRQALKSEGQALDFAREAKDGWRQGYVLRAQSLLHKELGDLLKGAEARQQYRQALARARQALELGLAMQEKEWQGLALHYQALALARLHREGAGLAAFDRALRLWSDIGDFYSLGHAHRFIAHHFHEKKGRFPQAQGSYDRALTAFAKIRDQESTAYTLLDQARLAVRRGQQAEAVKFFLEGLDRLEQVRTQAGFLEFKKTFLEKVYDRYEEAAVFLLENRRTELAFRCAESMKARVFLDQLAEGLVNVEKGIDPQLKNRRDELEQQLARTGERLAQEYREPSSDAGRLAALKGEYDRLSLELETQKRQIRLKNPLYAAIQYPKPTSLAALQEKILRPDEILLEYFVSKRGVYCFVITAQAHQVVKLAVTEAELNYQVGALLKSLKLDPFNDQPAQELYRKLVQPLESHLPGKTLIIVPDGLLARLPFEMLVLQEGDRKIFLLERHHLKYVQSASVLELIRTHYPHRETSDSFIGFGDPVYDYESFRDKKPEKEDGLKGGDPAALGTQLEQLRYHRAGYKLCRLEGSGKEVAAIAGLFREKKQGEKGLLRLDAREDQAKSPDMEHYGYIHFSCHGLLSPGYQAIALSQVPGEREDGFLTLGEIMNCRYQARLVVLSACQTGLGSLERGEGVTGLTRAVMYAGSPAVVVSLWPVDDRATQELMVRFYSHLIRQDLSKVEALRAARLEMLASPDKHPFFWAPFVMYGE